MRLPSATALPLDASREPSHARLEQAARGLETQFAQMLIKSMRSASMGDPMLGNNTTYREMYDQQLAKELSKGRGLGLAPTIMRQLERSTTPQSTLPATDLSLPLQRAGGAPRVESRDLADVVECRRVEDEGRDDPAPRLIREQTNELPRVEHEG